MPVQRPHQSETDNRNFAACAELPVHGGAGVRPQPLGAYRLRCTLLAPLGAREVFKVFEDARNLARITPPWLNFQVLTGAVAMRPGAEIDYVIRWLGLPMRWKTLITAYEPPRFFEDRQLEGPYALWHHRHDFFETPAGTVVSDCVDYKLPLGPLGRIAHAVTVRRQLLQIFRFRQAAMPELLGVECKPLEDPHVTTV